MRSITSSKKSIAAPPPPAAAKNAFAPTHQTFLARETVFQFIK